MEDSAVLPLKFDTNGSKDLEAVHSFEYFFLLKSNLIAQIFHKVSKYFRKDTFYYRTCSEGARKFSRYSSGTICQNSSQACFEWERRFNHAREIFSMPQHGRRTLHRCTSIYLIVGCKLFVNLLHLSGVYFEYYVRE